jgi:hypothetical protein
MNGHSFVKLLALAVIANLVADYIARRILGFWPGR